MSTVEHNTISEGAEQLLRITAMIPWDEGTLAMSIGNGTDPDVANELLRNGLAEWGDARPRVLMPTAAGHAYLVAVYGGEQQERA